MSAGLKGALIFFFSTSKAKKCSNHSELSKLSVSHAYRALCPLCPINVFSRRRMFLKKSLRLFHSFWLQTLPLQLLPCPPLYSRRCKLIRMQTHQPKLLVCDMLWVFASAKVTSSGMPGQLSPRKCSTASRDSKRKLICVHFRTEIDSQRKSPAAAVQQRYFHCREQTF